MTEQWYVHRVHVAPQHVIDAIGGDGDGIKPRTIAGPMPLNEAQMVANLFGSSLGPSGGYMHCVKPWRTRDET